MSGGSRPFMKDLWLQFFIVPVLYEEPLVPVLNKKKKVPAHKRNATQGNCCFSSWFQTYFVKKKLFSKIPVPVPKLSLGLALVPEPDLNPENMWAFHLLKCLHFMDEKLQ